MGSVVQNTSNAFLLKRDLAMIGVLTFCGLRRNELISLEVQDVDLFKRIYYGSTSYVQIQKASQGSY